MKSISLIYSCPQLCMLKYPESDGGQHPGHNFVPTVFSPVDSRDVKLVMKCSRRGNEKALKWQRGDKTLPTLRESVLICDGYCCL